MRVYRRKCRSSAVEIAGFSSSGTSFHIGKISNSWKMTLKCFPGLFHPVFNTLVSFCIRDLFQHLHKLLLPKAPKNKLK